MTSVQENKNELEAAVRYCESAISRAKATIESMEFRQQAATKSWHEQTGREAALEREVARIKEENAQLRSDRSGMQDCIKLRENQIGELKTQLVEERDRSMGYTNEVEKLKSEVDELEHAYNNMKQYADKLLDENGTMEAELEERISEVADLKGQIEGHRTNMALMTDQIQELEQAYKNECHETDVYKKSWREQREIVALKDDQIAMLERRLAKHAGEKTYPFKEGDIYYVFSALDGQWIESVWDDESERIHDSPSIPSHPHRVYFTIDQKNVIEQFNPESS